MTSMFLRILPLAAALDISMKGAHLDTHFDTKPNGMTMSEGSKNGGLRQEVDSMIETDAGAYMNTSLGMATGTGSTVGPRVGTGLCNERSSPGYPADVNQFTQASCEAFLTPVFQPGGVCEGGQGIYGWNGRECYCCTNAATALTNTCCGYPMYQMTAFAQSSSSVTTFHSFTQGGVTYGLYRVPFSSFSTDPTSAIQACMAADSAGMPLGNYHNWNSNGEIFCTGTGNGILAPSPSMASAYGNCYEMCGASCTLFETNDVFAGNYPSNTCNLYPAGGFISKPCAWNPSGEKNLVCVTPNAR